MGKVDSTFALEGLIGRR